MRCVAPRADFYVDVERWVAPPPGAPPPDAPPGAPPPPWNATAVNATAVNGTAVNGTALNGTDVKGSDLNATAANATGANATNVDSAAANATDYDRRTPLHLAAAEGRQARAEYLLAAGADPGAEDRFGQAALVNATRAKHTKLIKMLSSDHGARKKTQFHARCRALSGNSNGSGGSGGSGGGK